MAASKFLAELGILHLAQPTAGRDDDELDADGPLLPPEVVENIFDCIKDLNGLLKCRLVCQDWNTRICDILEKRNMSHWINFEERKFDKLELVPVSPLIEQRPNWVRGVGLGHVTYPPALKGWKKGSRNPFPSKSLTISRFPCLWNMDKAVGHGVTRWHSFFINYGHLISTLNLVDVKTTAFHLDMMLAHLPNLKALTMNLVRVPHEKSLERLFEKMRCFRNNSVSPYLEHLEIFWFMPPYVAKWLLDLCAQQLVTLALSTWDPIIIELCNRNFVNLKQLHILTPIFKGLAENWQLESAPSLQNLTIIIDTAEGDVTQYEYVATFIAKFASSLVTLCVNAKLFELEKILHFWKGSETRFGELKSLTLRDAADRDFDDDHYENGAIPEPVPDEDWKSFYLRLKAIKQLPNVLSVKFKMFKTYTIYKYQNSRVDVYVYPDFQLA